MNSNNTSQLMNKYNLLIAGKEEYLICAKDARCEYEVVTLYANAEAAYKTAALDTSNAHTALKNSQDAHKPQINAATMGGIVSGLAGPIAGAYAATQTARNNAAQDAARTYYGQQAFLAAKKSERSNNAFCSSVTQLDAKIQQLPNRNLANKDISYRLSLETKKTQLSVASKRLEKDRKNYDTIRKNFIPLLVTSLLSLAVTVFLFAIELIILGVILGAVTAFEIFGVCAGGVTLAQHAKDQEMFGKNKPSLSKTERELQKYKTVRKTHSYAQEKCTISAAMKKRKQSSQRTKKITT